MISIFEMFFKDKSVTQSDGVYAEIQIIPQSICSDFRTRASTVTGTTELYIPVNVTKIVCINKIWVHLQEQVLSPIIRDILEIQASSGDSDKRAVVHNGLPGRRRFIPSSRQPSGLALRLETLWLIADS